MKPESGLRGQRRFRHQWVADDSNRSIIGRFGCSRDPLAAIPLGDPAIVTGNHLSQPLGTGCQLSSPPTNILSWARVCSLAGAAAGLPVARPWHCSALLEVAARLSRVSPSFGTGGWCPARLQRDRNGLFHRCETGYSQLDRISKAVCAIGRLPSGRDARGGVGRGCAGTAGDSGYRGSWWGGVEVSAQDTGHVPGCGGNWGDQRCAAWFGFRSGEVIELS